MITLECKRYAVLLETKVNKTTGWPAETYVIREADGTPLMQVTLCRAKDGWFGWTGQCTRASDRHMCNQLAAARRAKESQ